MQTVPTWWVHITVPANKVLLETEDSAQVTIFQPYTVWLALKPECREITLPYKLLFLGHRSLIKNKTQTAVTL